MQRILTCSIGVLKGGKGTLPVDSLGAPWTSEYVFSSGDLVEDLTHNCFLENGAGSHRTFYRFSPDYAPEEIAEIAQRLRKEAGLA